jgi:RNA polymerase sigma-70 factor (ECF subfamily)
MNSNQTFIGLMDRLRKGDDDASTQIFRRYAQRLIALAKSRMKQAVQKKLDPEDIVQSVFRSFFVREADGQFQLGNWDNMWTILATITLRKCAGKARFFGRERRDMGKESEAAGAENWQELAAQEPTPDQAAMLQETAEKLLSRLEGRDRTICELTLQGKSAAEICQETGYAERTVRRVRETIKNYLERWAQSEEGE